MPPPPPPPPPPVAVLQLDHEHDLRRLAARRRRLEVDLAAAIDAALLAGYSYAAVGRLLGVSRQAVWERVHRTS